MQSLIQQLQRLGRHARRLLLCKGAALWICTVLVVLVIAGCADFWFRYSEAELRWLASGLVAWIVFWAAYKLVWPAIRIRNDEQLIAQWVERCFPDLQDRLTSAVTFAGSPVEDFRYGSPTLRESVVHAASAAVAERNLYDCLDYRALRRAGWMLLVALLAAVSICVADVQSATIAMRRIVMPWRKEVWPRRTWLMIAKGPRRIATGQDFVVEVIDRRGWLPSDVKILYWFDGDPESDVRVHPMMYAGGKMTHRLPQVTRGFRYRAIGGDDEQMEWVPLTVVEAPSVAALTIQMTPPTYTGLAPSSSDRTIRGYVGTEVKIAGRTSTPLRSIEMHFQSGKSAARMRAAVGSDRVHFQFPSDPALPWLLERSGSYGWFLVDQHGVTNELQPDGEVETLPDTPPTVTIESPSSQTPFTPSAEMSLRLVVRDDLAVQKILLDVAGKQVVIDERATPPIVDSSASWPPEGEQRSIEYALDLREAGEWQPGQSLTVRVVASDFRPQLSEPAELTITIISAEELKSRLDQSQSALLERIDEALRMQRSVRSQLLNVLDRVKESAKLSQEIPDNLAGLELGQQHVRDYVAGDHGALRLVSQLLEQIKSNRINDAELYDQVTATEKALIALNSEVLPPIEWQLGQAGKQARLQNDQGKSTTGAAVDYSPVRPSISAALEGQVRAIDSLEQMVDHLSQWSGYRRLAQDVAQLILEQESLVRSTQALPTAARDLIELSDAESGQLGTLNNQQTGLATRLDRLHQRLVRMRQQLSGDKLAAATIDAATGVLLDQGISSDMSDAGRQIAQNRLGAAVRLQQRALAGLRKLHNVLAQRVEQDPAQILQQLRSIGENIERIHRDQSTVADRSAAAERQRGNERQKNLAEIADLERQLIQELRKVEQQLNHLPASDVARLLKAGASHMAAAQGSAEKGDAASASQSARLAAQQLAAAAAQLARDQRQVEEEQSNEQLKWLSESISEFLAAERTLHDQTAEMAKQVAGRSELTQEQNRQTAQIAVQQLELSKQVSAAKGRITAENVFSLALERVAELMGRASQRLEQTVVDQHTVELQSQAIQHLERLTAAMTHSSNSPNVPENQNTEPGGPQEENQSRHSIVELRLLRAWQQEVNQRTDALFKAQSETKSPTPDQQRELAELIHEQSQLAELIVKFDE